MASDFTLAPSARWASPAAQIVSPSLMRALCRPARYAMGEAVHSLPLLFWLIDACRPSSYVSLGLGDGTHYFAACQAMEKQDHNARCYGFGAAEDDDAMQRIEGYNEENYGDFSKIYRSTAQNPVHEFRVGGIDLLHINLKDLNLEPDALKGWISDWAKKLSDQAVVLIQGGKNDEPLSAMLELMLKQAVPDRPSIEFARDQGSMLLLYGARQPDLLLKLAELRLGEAGYAEIQYVFSRLGQLHYKEWAHREARDELRQTQAALTQAESGRAEIESEKVALAERFEKINRAYDDRSDRTASLQTMLFDLQNDLAGKVVEISERDRALAGAKAELEALKLAAAERDRNLAAAEQASEAAQAERTAMDRRLTEVTTETQALKTRLTEEKAAREAARLETHDAGQQMKTRFQELALLTRRLEEREQLLAASIARETQAGTDRDRLQDEVHARDRQIVDLQTRLARVEGHYQKIRNTRSWRVTAPVRNLGKLVKKSEK